MSICRCKNRKRFPRQGMSVAIGAALSKKLNGDNHLVFSLHGDGELDEGQVWEAIMSATP